MESNDEVCLEASIHVVQTTGLVDEQLELTVHGLCPFQAACLRAVMRDNGGREWASHGLFQADEDGRIDLSSRVPIEGSYSVADSMGLFWSMHLQASEVTPATPLAPLKTKLTVEVNEQAAATRNIVRHVVAPDVTRIPVRENGLVGTLFIPAGTGPHPVVHLHYPRAGHAIVPPFYSTTHRVSYYDLGGTPSDDAAAQADSWPKILEFLKASFD
jgi:hypothetical protein